MGKKPVKKAGKKPARKTSAAKSGTIASARKADKKPETGDQVVYILTEEESENYGKPARHTVGMEVLRVLESGEAILKGEVRQGQPWERGAYEGTTPGSWHWPR